MPKVVDAPSVRRARVLVVIPDRFDIVVAAGPLEHDEVVGLPLQGRPSSAVKVLRLLLAMEDGLFNTYRLESGFPDEVGGVDAHADRVAASPITYVCTDVRQGVPVGVAAGGEPLSSDIEYRGVPYWLNRPYRRNLIVANAAGPDC